MVCTVFPTPEAHLPGDKPFLNHPVGGLYSILPYTDFGCIVYTVATDVESGLDHEPVIWTRRISRRFTPFDGSALSREDSHLV
jgi:hypothetical protein